MQDVQKPTLDSIFLSPASEVRYILLNYESHGFAQETNFLYNLHKTYIYIYIYMYVSDKYHIYRPQLLSLSALFCHRSWSGPSTPPSATNKSKERDRKVREG
jgi:hypothetical protein